jgi:Cof subfamily protein (haloacid dehalogenase superfamily)
MKNIYITDLDHTFLKTDLSISDYTKKIWNSYADKAILSVATARTYRKTEQFLRGLKINAPMILLDGSLIATMDKKIIDTKFISKEIADEIIDIGVRVGIYPFLLSLEEGDTLNEAFIHSNILNSYQKEVLGRYVVEDNLQERKTIRANHQNFKIVYMGEEKQLRELEDTIKGIFGDRLKYILAPEAYVGCYFLTILHKDADKAHGIKSVSEYMNLSFENLTVFGDNFNDVGMFELAKTSVAVANAQDGVKKLADIVLKYTNDEDGVARYLKESRYEK